MGHDGLKSRRCILLFCRTPKKNNHRLWGLYLLLSGISSLAQASVGLLPDFPVSESVYAAGPRDVPEYPFVASTLSTVRGEVKASQLYSLKGTLRRETLEIGGLHSPDDVIEHYAEALEGKGARMLFRCEARDCGRSNDWANVIYERRTLFGPDRDQRYVAAILEREGELPLAVSVYVIQRGNQRLYAHLEVVQVESGLEPLLSGRKGQTAVWLSADVLGRSRALSDTLDPWLEKARSLGNAYQVYLVTYYRSASDPASEDLEKARRQGETLRSWLGSQRIPPEKIQVITVGPFAQDALYTDAPGKLHLILEQENGG